MTAMPRHRRQAILREASGYIELGELLVQQDKPLPPSGQRLLHRALDLLAVLPEPTRLKATAKLLEGEALRALGRWEKSLAAFQMVADREPKRLEAWLGMGWCLKRLGRLDDLKVVIVGDILHSRVARSDIEAFQMMGLDVTLIGPPALIPPGIVEATGVKVSDDPEAMSEADVIYVLRMQHERMEPGQNYLPSLREYARVWGVNARRVRPGQVVMHPGPMNRGVEIAPDVADSGVSLVENQVEAGLVVRMAVLYDLMTRPSIGTVIDIRERTGEWGAA